MATVPGGGWSVTAKGEYMCTRPEISELIDGEMAFNKMRGLLQQVDPTTISGTFSIKLSSVSKDLIKVYDYVDYTFYMNFFYN